MMIGNPIARQNQVMNPNMDSERESVRVQEPLKVVYETPLLRALGDVREMTLGGSLGTGDSGNAAVQRF